GRQPRGGAAPRPDRRPRPAARPSARRLAHPRRRGAGRALRLTGVTRFARPAEPEESERFTVEGKTRLTLLRKLTTCLRSRLRLCSCPSEREAAVSSRDVGQAGAAVCSSW